MQSLSNTSTSSSAQNPYAVSVSCIKQHRIFTSRGKWHQTDLTGPDSVTSTLCPLDSFLIPLSRFFCPGFLRFQPEDWTKTNQILQHFIFPVDLSSSLLLL